MNTWVSFRSARSSEGGQISVGANSQAQAQRTAPRSAALASSHGATPVHAPVGPGCRSRSPLVQASRDRFWALIPRAPMTAAGRSCRLEAGRSGRSSEADTTASRGCPIRKQERSSENPNRAGLLPATAAAHAPSRSGGPQSGPELRWLIDDLMPRRPDRCQGQYVGGALVRQPITELRPDNLKHAVGLQLGDQIRGFRLV